MLGTPRLGIGIYIYIYIFAFCTIYPKVGFLILKTHQESYNLTNIRNKYVSSQGVCAYR